MEEHEGKMKENLKTKGKWRKIKEMKETERHKPTKPQKKILKKCAPRTEPGIDGSHMGP